MNLVSLLLISSIANAQVSKTNLFRKPEVKAVAAPKPLKVSPGSKIEKQLMPIRMNESGNLPIEYRVRNFTNIRANENPVTLPSSPQIMRLRALPLGTVVNANILESVVGFTDAKSPVRAVIRSGQLLGAVLLGEASLEKNSKRLTIEFKKIRLKDSQEVYQLIASAMDVDGVLGLEGEHHSGESKLFAGEIIAAAAAGFADSTIERSTTAFGQVQDQPSLDTSSKKALSGALSRTADRFAERMRASPEYSILRGPTEIKILIVDQPRLLE